MVSVLIEKELISKLVYEPDLIKVCRAKGMWFKERHYRDILDVLVENYGDSITPNELYERVKLKRPDTLLTASTIEDLRIDGMMVDDMDVLTDQLERNYLHSNMMQASRMYADYSSEDNFQKMQDAMRELEDLDQNDESGKLESAFDKIRHQLYNDDGEGIKTYNLLDKALGGGLYGGELAIIGARPGVGKGHPAWLKLPTPKGNKRMDELEVNDYVFDRYGQPTKITGVYPRGELETYKVTLRDGRSTIVDGDHIWSYYSMSGSGKENLVDKTTSEMYQIGTKTSTNRSRYSIPTNGVVEFEEKEHAVDPYVIGALIGDGCLLESRLTISSGDDEVVQKVGKIIGKEGIFSKFENYNWHFKDDVGYVMSKDFVMPDEIKTYSHLKSIPESYLYDSYRNRLNLLNGLFDTDGHATRNSNRLYVGYTTTSKKLVKQIRWLLQSIGLLSGVVTDRREGRRDCFNISVLAQSEDMEKLFTLERKLKVVKGFNRTKRRKYDRIQIESIEKTGETEEIICISVDNEEQLYLANDFIVTHNTAYGINLAIQAMSRNDEPVVDFFTLEMTQESMLKRFISRTSEINSMRLRNPYKNLSDAEKLLVEEKSREFLGTHLRIYDDKFNLKDIEIEIRRRHHEADGKPYLPVIDYLQLINVEGRSENQNVEVGKITRTLKLLSNELDIPIIVLSQLNREMEADERPSLKNLRDSGNIEQDASLVLFLFNEVDEVKGNNYGYVQKEPTNRVICYIAKNRHGIPGDLFYRFLKSKMYFQELDE